MEQEIQKLIRTIADGDSSALLILYDRTSRLLFGLVLRVLGNRPQAEETLLDIYTHIWTHRAFSELSLPPLQWLTTTARARAIAKLHWSRRDRVKRERSAAAPDPVMTVDPQLQELARSSMNALVPAQREILDWAYYSGLNCGEIAAQLGRPLGAIKTHARLGLNKLSRLLFPTSESADEPDPGGHPEVREWAPLYALGSLTQHEARSFEIHLQEGCTVCASELRKLERAVAGIGFSAGEAEAPEYIRDLLAARVERESQASASAASSPPKSAAEPPRRIVSPPRVPPPLFSQTGRERPSFAPWILAAAMALAAILAIYAWKSAQETNNQLQAKVSAAATDSDNLRIMLDVQKEKSQGLEQILSILSKPRARMARLTGQAETPSASAGIAWDIEQNRCLLFGAFPPEPPGKIYQLWFVSPVAKVRVGTVRTNPSGRALIDLVVPKEAAGAIEAIVTLEPDNGSQIPSTPFCAVGHFN